MMIKNELIIACHPPLRLCWILPEVNYEWAKNVLLDHKHKSYIKLKRQISKSNKNFAKLNELISVCKGKNIMLLELGVGVNTPGIIRYPFEQLALQRKNTTLFRINLNMNHLTLISKAENAVQIQADIGKILSMVN